MCANGNITMNKSAIKKKHTQDLWKQWISSSILTLLIINVQCNKHVMLLTH